MADILLSPGVATREFDKSQLTKQPIQYGGAIIGPTVKGIKNIPKLVTNYSEYQAHFGSVFTSGSFNYTYFTSISAYNYFQNGGRSLLVTRVSEQPFSEATSTRIQSGDKSVLSTASLYSGGLDIQPFFTEATTHTSASFTLNGIEFKLTSSTTAQDWATENTSTQIIVPIKSTVPLTAYEFSTFLNASQSVSTYSILNGLTSSQTGDWLNIKSTLTGSNYGFYGNSSYITSQSVTQYFISGSSRASFELETLSQGELMNNDNTTLGNYPDGTYFANTIGITTPSAENPLGAQNSLVSGSKDNLRWEITNPDVKKGIFSVVIRQGNDKQKAKTILETFANVSLDPKASNYIERIIGNQRHTLMGSGANVYLQVTGSYKNASDYIRVKKVYMKTPDYLDSDGIAKTKYTASIPIAQSGAFGGATGRLFPDDEIARYYNNITNTNTQGIKAAGYTDAINLLANQDDYKYNLITTPGLIKSETAHSTQLNTLLSNTKERGDTMALIDPVLYNSTMASAITQAESVNSSYAAMYWPWLQVTDPDTGQLDWVPASVMVPGAYAYNDKIGQPWTAPAGKKRGKLGTVRQTERKLTNANRDTLYVGKVNPIATFPAAGVVVFGQKTLQTKSSALDRINVRRLLIALKSFISQVADTLVFEQNSIPTRNSFLSKVNPYLEFVKQKQGLYSYKLVMDESNNTADVIDRNQMVGQIFIQPTKTAEFIYLDFNILPTGATFPS